MFIFDGIISFVIHSYVLSFLTLFFLKCPLFHIFSTYKIETILTRFLNYFSSTFLKIIFYYFKCHSWAQRLINLEIPVLVRSLKSSNVELG